MIVVGGGAAGENVAGRCAAGGLDVVLVERDLVGGECSFWACMPTKAMLRPGEALASVVRVPGARYAIDGPLDVAAALARRDALAASWDDRHQAQWLADQGVDLVRGHARLAGPLRVSVDTPEGERLRFSANHAVVLATGSSTAVPPIRGLESVRVWDNRDAAATQSVPDRLVVVGGGPVGCELAQAFLRLGSRRVTLVEAGNRLLPGEEPFAGDLVRDSLMAEGVLVLLGSTVHRVLREGEDGPVTALITSGQTVTADELVLATGRWPNTADVGLETVGLRAGDPVSVDDFLRAGPAAGPAAGAWLYAVGDVNERALFTHAGKYQARLAADAILARAAGQPDPPAGAWADRRALTRVVFTDPQVAAAGLTESQAGEAGIDVVVVSCPVGSVPGAAVRGEGTAALGTCQLVVDRHRHVVVGATFCGPEVAEMLHAATVAIVGEVPIDRLRHAVPAFPTVSEVWLKLVEGYLGSAR